MTIDIVDPPSEAGPLLTGRHGARFFGEPRPLAFLAFTEAWERFSYYGMTSILVLYMSHALFLPGHIGNIAGFAPFQQALEAVFGKLSTLALASQIYGLYTGFVYFTPVFGGWIADRFIGRRTAVVIGAALMSAGHFAMALDRTFLVALLLLIVGCGLLKGNISAQVGSLYAPEDGNGRTRAFSIFSMSINVGAIAGPLVIGFLADRYGWHIGFALAGFLMLAGLATYLGGYRYLPEDHPGRRASKPHDPLTRKEWLAIGGLVAVMGLIIFQTISYYQNCNLALIWIDTYVDRDVLGFQVPVAWFTAVDPVASIAFVPILFAFWRWQQTRGINGSEIARIATGAFIAACANLLLAVASLGGGRVSPLYPIFYNGLLAVAFLHYWPTLLALVSRAAPRKVNSTIMGTVFLSVFIGNIVIGWVGGFYERMAPAQFWMIHAAIGFTGTILSLILMRPLSRLLKESAS